MQVGSAGVICGNRGGYEVEILDTPVSGGLIRFTFKVEPLGRETVKVSCSVACELPPDKPWCVSAQQVERAEAAAMRAIVEWQVRENYLRSLPRGA